MPLISLHDVRQRVLKQGFKLSVFILSKKVFLYSHGEIAKCYYILRLHFPKLLILKPTD
jgi:hypothetical protein